VTDAPGAAKIQPDYAVPALDKALDILELLADQSAGLSQLEIARATDRSPSQIFRVLVTLERRGYLYRDRPSGLYMLAMHLFDLAHRQEPLRSLIAAALAAMRPLADELQQSCNLSVLDAGRVRVIAQVESPAEFGFRVRVGALFALETTATGLVLQAFGPRQAVALRATDATTPGATDAATTDAVDAATTDAAATDGAATAARIRADGHLERPDAQQPSITDIVFPILRSDGTAAAALTVPYVSTSFSERSIAAVTERAAAAAAEISRSLAL
jgi:DNA-binding IclR family transcriptional regulator